MANIKEILLKIAKNKGLVEWIITMEMFILGIGMMIVRKASDG